MLDMRMKSNLGLVLRTENFQSLLQLLLVSISYAKQKKAN